MSTARCRFVTVLASMHTATRRSLVVLFGITKEAYRWPPQKQPPANNRLRCRRPKRACGRVTIARRGLSLSPTLLLPRLPIPNAVGGLNLVTSRHCLRMPRCLTLVELVHIQQRLYRNSRLTGGHVEGVNITMFM